MKKIAFISNGFTGSIIPLVNEFLKLNYQVDLFLVVFKTQNQTEHEAFKLLQGNYGYGIHCVPKDTIVGVEWLSNKELFTTYLVCNFGNGRGMIKKVLAHILQLYVKNKLVNTVSQANYDYINVVGHDLFCSELSLSLKNKRILHTFHEVYNHSSAEKEILPSVSKLVKAKIPIIVPSEHLKSYLNAEVAYNKVYSIKMGLFIGYKSFDKNVSIVNLPASYILFLGNLLPYKGLDLLYESYLLLKRQGRDVNIVIAGGGNSPLLEKMKNNDDFTIINRWILNDELVSLIKKTKAIICPYHSASQSGLPVTAYVFGKPVIATDVGAMSEYVLDKETGYLVAPNNPNLLSEKMWEIYTDSMSFNNEVLDKIIPSWEDISLKYLECFNNKYNCNNDD